jgi:ADP-ribose pyrophosphatase YjhB (NUDIX family)
MYCNYKIYYNDSFVLLSGDRSQINKNFTRILTEEKEIRDFLANPSILFDKEAYGNIFVACCKPGETMCQILEGLEIVIAGGGIVSNEFDELLLIFRRGKWDMAKGKIEWNERIIDGAVREVEEETGVKIETVDEKPCSTYHAYKLKGRNCLKETSWFKMKDVPGKSQLTPQTEEDIEEVRWVKKTELNNYRQISFPLIWDLLAPYALKAAESGTNL